MPKKILKVSLHISDPLVDYLVELFYNAGFDSVEADGSMYCSDSNASLDPHEVAKHLRENFGAK